MYNVKLFLFFMIFKPFLRTIPFFFIEEILSKTLYVVHIQKLESHSFQLFPDENLPQNVSKFTLHLNLPEQKL